ncbi:hypothetical protein P3342_001403 [Pyrenophora teres f. teres]|nr:hypothetical protein P3342_001403 [Pyrenophora teres f. teres]
MTVSDAPQWLQTATRKKQLRDEAIQRFVDAETTLSELNGSQDTNGNLDELTAVDGVDSVSIAITSRAMTASQLLHAYINRAIDAHRRTNWQVPITTTLGMD